MSGKNTLQYVDKVIMAPMVKIGTLAARLLSIRYGADLVYSEELVDWKILNCKRIMNDALKTTEYVDQSDGTVVFSTCEEERSKVILQIGTSDAQRALKTALLVENDIAGLDVNMGCPKDFSLKGGMGAALLRQPEKIKSILTTLVSNVKIPVTCKIRVLANIEDTLTLCKMIESCGVSAIAIHGRTVKERRQHKNRNSFIKTVSEALSIPVIANGGSNEIKMHEDIETFKANTGCSSVMLARACEHNYSIFRKDGKESLDDVVRKYIKISIDTGNNFPGTKYTIQHMLRELQETPRGKQFLGTQLMSELCDIWKMGDYLHQKEEEWRTSYSGKRSIYSKISDENSNENENPPAKKSKLNLDDNDLIILSDCVYLRGHYPDVETLPKTVLQRWCRRTSANFPTYETEYVDKQFRSVASLCGKRFMTDHWVRNKRFAEQEAAMVCIKYLKIQPGE